MAKGLKSIHPLVVSLNRQADKLTTTPTPKSIHRFRTSARRMETLLAELQSEPGRNHIKLLKLLARLRKKAGRVRDLDVQISLLRNLKMPEGARHKTQLLQALTEERSLHEKKVASLFDKRTLRELRKRSARAESKLAIDETIVVSQFQGIVRELINQSSPVTEDVLDQYRVSTKRARYLAEVAGRGLEKKAEHVARIHSALGEWRDWMKLSRRAEKLFRAASGSPLVAALQNLTRAKFRNAVTALADGRANLSGKRPAEHDASPRKATSTVAATSSAA